MYKIAVLNYTGGKLAAVIAIKSHLNLGLKEAKDWVESLPIRLENQDLDDVEFYRGLFRCDVMEEKSPYESNHNIIGPDDNTKEALAWLEGQSAEDKARIDLIGKWYNQPLIAVC